MAIFEQGPDRDIHLLDYVAIIIVALGSCIRGTWTGLCQIPTYVGSTYGKYKKIIVQAQKERVDGMTERERRIDAISPSDRNSMSQDAEK